MKNFIKNYGSYLAIFFLVLIGASFFYQHYQMERQRKVDQAFELELQKEQKLTELFELGAFTRMNGYPTLELSTHIAVMRFRERAKKIDKYEKDNPRTTLLMQNFRDWNNEFLKRHPEAAI